MTSPDPDLRSRLLQARLPVMPQILLKLLELCQADGAGMAEIARLVGSDAAMSVKLLQAANSAAYNRGGQKVGLQQGLGLLGSDMIKSLVISESVLQAFNGFAGGAASDLRRFWKHALLTAVLARDIARALNYAQPEEAYLAGLLHDVGRLALLAAAPDTYQLYFLAEDGASLCAAEREALHITHMEAGAWVVQRWQLDSFLGDAILYHHEPLERLSGAHLLVRMVFLAHALAGHDLAEPLPHALETLCQIPAPQLVELCEGAEMQVYKAASYLGIDLTGLEQPAAVADSAAAPAVDAAQRQLNDEVRDLALLNALGLSFARPKDDGQLLRLIRQQAQLLLELDSSAIFLMNGSGQHLLGASVPETRQRLLDFSIALGTDGVLDQATRGGLAFAAGGPGMRVAEEQLLRALGGEVLLCLPLCQGAQCLGLLLAGVTQRQRARLQRQERLLLGLAERAAAALQALAAGASADQRIATLQHEHREHARRVVHEINNPLSIIKNYLEVLDDKLAHQQPVQGEMDVLHGEIDRIGNIMGEYVGGAPAAQRSRGDVNHTIQTLAQLLRQSKFLPASVELVVQTSSQRCEIDGSADALKQILLNLLKNAVEALGRGGRIEIVNNGQVQRNGRPFYAICVSDNGPGIPPEHRSRLFSPVQSRKPGSNRGLGLSIVQGLVKQLGGSIACLSTTSMGTLFELCLPVPADLQLQAAAPSASLQDMD